MKLTLSQKQVLWAVQNNAALPLSQAAKRCGLKERTVRAAIERLTELEVIYPLHLVDVALLGYTHFNIFFSLAVKNPASRDKLLAYLIASDRVALLNEVGGEYDYAMSICAVDVQEALKFLEDLGRTFGDIFADKSIITRAAYIGFGRKYLTGRKVSPIIVLGQSQGHEQINEQDREVLKVLSRTHNRSAAVLARATRLSPNTFRYRWERLRERGIVPYSIYALTPWRYGYQTYRLLLSAASLSGDFHDLLYKYAARHPNIVSIVRTLGSWDYELGIEVQESTACPSLVQEIKYQFGDHLTRTSTLPIFRFLKGVTYPFD